MDPAEGAKAVSAFDDLHHAAFVCPHIFGNVRPVLLVVFDDGDWQFLCGEPHEGGPHVVGIGHLIERDATLLELQDLPEGWEAEREYIGAKWIRRSVETDE